MAGCLISPVIEIGKFICPFLKPHVDYWWFFDDNIQDLRNRTGELMQRRCNIEEQRKLVLHTDNLLRPLEDWLKESTDKLEEAHKILLPNDNIPHASNLISRYSLGKNAKKIAEEIANLINKGEFNNTADPAPQPAMAYPFHGPNVDFKSRKSIEKEIIDSLKKSSVDMIGICGMGGVGKTTMARSIEKTVKEEKLFDEVVRVTVSQTTNLPKIQNEIADSLKLKFDESNRANQLRTRLMDEKTKIIIFDDVWESLNFEELGFPIECNFERCKVLLTSRSRDTCKTIKNKVVFDLKNLGEEESWILFKDKAGNCVEDPNLQPVARNVAKECKGLPLALVTLGIALQGETNIGRWNSSLSELKQSNPSDLTQVLNYVYKALKLSYDCLEKEGKRNLFLMCCLFPEDYDIPIEQLTWYRMFGDNTIIEEPNITNIEDARNQTNAWVEELKSRSLLIAGEDKLHVKMHDLVRDVAIYIGSKKSHGFLKSLHRSSKENLSDVNCNWMSVDISNGQMEVPVLSRFPKLRLLMLSSNLSSNQFSDISFKGIKDLNVLSFQNISIRSLASTRGSLANLKMLRLFRCQVENISFIGKLTSLKILSCYGCPNITELPAEIGSLKDLMLLELSKCSKLQRIPFGIISSLSLLEELKIRGSFSEWETGGESRNASLTELECLRNLTCLEIEISDCNLSAQEIRLSQKLVKYRICIALKGYGFEETDCEKEMNLKLLGAVGNWIQLLARNAEWLSLEGDGSDNINLAEMENLRKLKFSYCSTVKKLVDTSYLNQNVSLCNLKSIYISRCFNIKHVFSVSVARTRLPQLECLHIEDCEGMEQVFLNEGTNDNTDGCIEFPKLKKLRLRNLPNLTAFCQGLFENENIIIKFPNLTAMNIFYLPKLNSIFPLYSKDVSFYNLRSICISECHNLRYLFSVSPARRCLLQLEFLSIENCKAMKQVFWNEDTDDNTDGCIEFPKLKELSLRNLPNLTAFCQGLENIIIKFPNLTKMNIEDLPKLNSIFPLNSKDVSFCNLKSIYIYQCHNLRYLFSESLARRCLLQLEFLSIKFCKSMEQVFWNEIKDNNTYGCIEFSKLKQLTLWKLPNLIAFCQGLENIIIKFPNLTKMDIEGLSKLNSLFPPNSETVENTCFHLFCNPKDISFCNLKFISISECHNLRYLFSLSEARRCLLQLEFLEILYCDSIEQVFWNEGTGDNTDGCIEFPKLKQLKLMNLPNLTTAFCQGLENIIIKFPNLTNMSIRELPKLNSHFPPNSETVENTCFHLFCNPKVEMSPLKELTLSDFEDNIKNIWCRQILNNFFNNLEILDINDMNGIKSLMSTSIAENLISLKSLRISDCKEMVEVIEIDDDNDKQVLAINCWFPNLKSLSIRHMPKLTRFWLWNHALELPLLEEMYIYDCTVMETFTLRSVNTPNIKTIVVNHIHIVNYKDLNDVMRHVRTKDRRSLAVRFVQGSLQL